MLITRSHTKHGCVSSAVYSPCERYRYTLTRTWKDRDTDLPTTVGEETGRRLLYIMLNPSTASERVNDPTIERCERRARALGFGAFRACNLFALRATDPRDLKKAKEPIGPANITQLLASASWADVILCAWGTHGRHLGMADVVTDLLLSQNHALQCLGLTKHGDPQHPLYVRNATPLVPFDPIATIPATG